MIHNDIQNQLQLLIKVSAPPLIEVAETQLELPQLVPGQRLQATVLASLPNGRFQAMIAGQTLDLNLPRNTQPGEKLDLTFVSNQPRLTFALTRDIPPPVVTSQGQSLVTISDSAKFLGALLQKVAEQAESQASSHVKLSPLLNGAPEASKEFAKTLQNALSQSGLFYESHQAQWVSGQRPLPDLLQEPQGKLSNVAQPNHVPSASSAPSEPADSIQKSMPMQSGEKVHPLTTPLIQQQLEVLDTRQLVWQGQVWPGQEMKWEIEEDGHKGQAHENDESAWKTNLHLNFPNLGDVTATLAVSSNGIRINFNVADKNTVSTLKTNQSDLQGAMHTAGLNLLSVSIDHNEKA